MPSRGVLPALPFKIRLSIGGTRCPRGQGNAAIASLRSANVKTSCFTISE